MGRQVIYGGPVQTFRIPIPTLTFVDGKCFFEFQGIGGKLVTFKRLHYRSSAGGGFLIRKHTTALLAGDTPTNAVPVDNNWVANATSAGFTVCRYKTSGAVASAGTIIASPGTLGTFDHVYEFSKDDEDDISITGTSQVLVLGGLGTITFSGELIFQERTIG